MNFKKSFVVVVMLCLGFVIHSYAADMGMKDMKGCDCSRCMDGCAMEKSRVSMPLIGDDAPAFSAVTTQGDINFPKDYKGKWVILFSHPADFTPVCTTEFMTFAKMMPEFKELNCELIGLSIDSKFSHIAWLRTIKEKIKYKDMANMEVTFPLIEDIKMDVAKKYGMVQPNASGTQAVRAVFYIDPNAKIRALVYYPLSNGRNFQEIKRLLIAMQTSDKYKIATPADWQPGDDVIVPPPGSCGLAKERVDNASKEGNYCLDWFICFKKLSKDMLTPALLNEKPKK
jgi:peroxiredoxin (alkyl hydroperoxide reductase subunit C)